RAFHVTGVQTCALPISINGKRDGNRRRTGDSGGLLRHGHLGGHLLQQARGRCAHPHGLQEAPARNARTSIFRVVTWHSATPPTRSEERRVGREGGPWRS